MAEGHPEPNTKARPKFRDLPIVSRSTYTAPPLGPPSSEPALSPRAPSPRPSPRQSSGENAASPRNRQLEFSSPLRAELSEILEDDVKHNMLNLSSNSSPQPTSPRPSMRPHARAVAVHDSSKRRSVSSPSAVDKTSIEIAKETREKLARLNNSANKATVQPERQSQKFADILTGDTVVVDDDDFVDRPVIELALKPNIPINVVSDLGDTNRSRKLSRLTDKLQERFKSLVDFESHAVTDGKNSVLPRPANSNRGSRIAMPSVSKLLSTKPESWSAPRISVDGSLGDGPALLKPDLERIPTSEIDSIIEELVGQSRTKTRNLSKSGGQKGIHSPGGYTCASCSLPIQDGSIFSANSCYYHESCFLCSRCRSPCNIEQYYSEGSNIYCEDCRSLLTPTCFLCGRSVIDVAVRDHATQNLFHENCYEEFLSIPLFPSNTPVSSNSSPRISPAVSTSTQTPVPSVPSRTPVKSNQETPAVIVSDTPIKPETTEASSLASRSSPNLTTSVPNLSPSNSSQLRRKPFISGPTDKFGFKTEGKVDSSTNDKKTFDLNKKLFASFKKARSPGKGVTDWDDYVSSLNDNLDNVKLTEQLKNLIRLKGIPPKLKEAVWVRVTTVYESYKNNMNCYESVLAVKGIAQNLSTAQIEKDIHRTFPDNVYFNTDEGRQSLFRVLHAFSWVNPEIGYCQSMNFLAGLILLFASEETTFWLISTIVEEILPPDYYTPSMTGIKADTLAFNALMTERMPQLMKHFEQHELDLTMFTTQWFLCLYINYLPIESTIWFFDCFLSEGNKMLFRVALALFSMNKATLLKASDLIKLMEVIKALPKKVTSLETLKEHCFNHSTTSNLKREHIEELRSKALADIVDNDIPTAAPRTKLVQSRNEFNFFDRPSGESSRAMRGWSEKKIFEDYSAFETYRRLPAAQRRGALALGEDPEGTL